MNQTTEPTENRMRPAQYDAVFGESAVSLLEEGTRSIAALGRELGISHKTLSKWRQRHGAAAAGARSVQTLASLHTKRRRTRPRGARGG